MQKHYRIEQEIFKCTNCKHEKTDKNNFHNHIVDEHSTFHLWKTCENKFDTKKELIAQIVRNHGFKKTDTNTTQATTGSSQQN